MTSSYDDGDRDIDHADRVTTRRARAADAPALADLAVRSYQRYPERMDGQRPAPMDADYAASIARDVVWVAEVGERLAGLLVLVDEPTTTLVENVAVDPDLQGHGIGRVLMAIADDHAKATGRSAVRLYTHSTMHENQRLYAHLGYAEVARQLDDGFDRVFYEKSVRGQPAE